MSSQEEEEHGAALDGNARALLLHHAQPPSISLSLSLSLIYLHGEEGAKTWAAGCR